MVDENSSVNSEIDTVSIISFISDKSGKEQTSNESPSADGNTTIDQRLGSVKIKRSSKIKFGNQSYYQAPVTIHQFISSPDISASQFGSMRFKISSMNCYSTKDLLHNC